MRRNAEIYNQSYGKWFIKKCLKGTVCLYKQQQRFDYWIIFYSFLYIIIAKYTYEVCVNGWSCSISWSCLCLYIPLIIALNLIFILFYSSLFYSYIIRANNISLYQRCLFVKFTQFLINLYIENKTHFTFGNQLLKHPMETDGETWTTIGFSLRFFEAGARPDRSTDVASLIYVA